MISLRYFQNEKRRPGKLKKPVITAPITGFSNFPGRCLQSNICITMGNVPITHTYRSIVVGIIISRKLLLCILLCVNWMYTMYNGMHRLHE